MKYNLTATKNPSFGIFSNNDSFIYVERRIGQVNDSFIENVIEHLDFLNIFRVENELKGFLQIRSLWYNDKAGDFVCNVDYLFDKRLGISSEIDIPEYIYVQEGVSTKIEITVRDCIFDSDHFDKNHQDFYTDVEMY